MTWPAKTPTRSWVLYPVMACTIALIAASALAAPSRAYTEFVRYPGNGSSSPQELTVSGGNLYFAADDGIHGQELWCLEPGKAPHLAADIWQGPHGSAPRCLLSMGGLLYFVAQHDFDGHLLDVVLSLEHDVDSLRSHLDAKANPSPAGTITLAGVAGRLYGAAYVQGLGREFVQFLPGPSLKCTDTMPGFTGGLLEKQEWFGTLGDKLVFTVQGPANSERLLWVAEPGAEPHGLVRKGDDLHWQGFTFPMSLDIVGDHIYVSANYLQDGIELWVSDGTKPGTRFVKDIYPGPDSSFPAGATEFQGVAYFRADDGVHGMELWKTDGTEAGTQLVKDLQPGPGGSGPYSFRATPDGLFFCASTEEHGNELWRTDGTPEGTHLVRDVFPGPESSNPYQLTAFGDTLLFAAANPDSGEELWRSDGTENGTYVVKDIRPGPELSEPYYLTCFDGRVYFAANDGRHGEELWSTDGTEEGTRLVADLHPETRTIRSADPTHLTAAEGGVYFVADDLTHGAELWWTDSQTRENHLVEDIALGSAHSDPEYLTFVGDRLYFAANDMTHGVELWRTIGHAASAELVADMCTGEAGSFPSHFVALPEGLLFAATPRPGETALYYLDFEAGLPNSISPVENLVPGGRLEALSRVNGTVYAVLRDQGDGYDFALWNEETMTFDMFPLTLPAGPQWPDVRAWVAAHPPEDNVSSSRILECYFALPYMGGRYCLARDAWWFSAYMPETGMELWRSASGAAEAIPAQDCFPGRGSSGPEHLVSAGGNMYFIAEGLSRIRDLWFVPSAFGEARPIGRRTEDTGFGPDELTPFRNGIRFVCLGTNSTARDRVLAWCGEDGSAPAVQRCPPPQAQLALNPRELTVSGEFLYFTAENAAMGREIWRTRGGATIEFVANVLSEPEYRDNYTVSPSVFQP